MTPPTDRQAVVEDDTPFSNEEWAAMRAYVSGNTDVLPTFIAYSPRQHFKRMMAHLDRIEAIRLLEQPPGVGEAARAEAPAGMDFVQQAVGLFAKEFEEKAKEAMRAVCAHARILSNARQSLMDQRDDLQVENSRLRMELKALKEP